MIVSIDIAEVGSRSALRLLRKRPRVRVWQIAGLRYAETVFAAPLGGGLVPKPEVGTVALIAAWDDDDALDSFAGHPLSQELSSGWQVRMVPLRISGSWPEMPGLPEKQLPVESDEPVAVLTLGRLKPWRLGPFLRAAGPAEAEVIVEPDLLASTGFARPPRLVSTFSLWRTAAAMRDYAYREGGSHRAAVDSDRSRPFHHASAFIRLRPYATRGSWSGRNPLPLEGSP